MNFNAITSQREVHMSGYEQSLSNADSSTSKEILFVSSDFFRSFPISSDLWRFFIKESYGDSLLKNLYKVLRTLHVCVKHSVFIHPESLVRRCRLKLIREAMSLAPNKLESGTEVTLFELTKVDLAKTSRVISDSKSGETSTPIDCLRTLCIYNVDPKCST